MTTRFPCCAREIADDDHSLPDARCMAVSPPSNTSRWMHTLVDGTPVTIRSMHPREARERAARMARSAEMRRYRFLASTGEAGKNRTGTRADIDQPGHVAFVALVLLDGIEHEVGIACYSTNADDSSCECSVSVADDWQRNDVESLLTQHLIDVAHMHGMHAMTSLDANGNRQMHDWVARLGFRCEVDPDDATQVTHTLARRIATPEQKRRVRSSSHALTFCHTRPSRATALHAPAESAASPRMHAHPYGREPISANDDSWSPRTGNN